MKLKAILEPQAEGGYVAYVPALPGCFSQGETMEEALKNIREAIELYLETVEERELKRAQRGILKKHRESAVVEVSV